MKFFGFLNKCYPFNDNLKQNTKIIFFLSIGIIAFLLIFQPIIRDLSFNDKMYIIGGFFIINLFSLSINLLILPNLFPKIFNPQKWKIKKEIIWNLWILITIYFGDFVVYNKLLSVIELSFNIIINLLMIAILPVTIIITYNRNRMLRVNLESAKKINNRIEELKNPKEKEILIESDYKKDDLNVKVNSIIQIKSSGNYIDVYWSDNIEVKHQLVRTTLTKVEILLKDYKFITKCHRSYLVNLNKISKIEGNSLGYTLYFGDNQITAPVSQTYFPKFKQYFIP